MSTATNVLPGIVMCGLSQEKAYDVIAELSEVQKNVTDNVTVYSGIHKQHGAVHIIVTLIGDPVMLPIIVKAVAGFADVEQSNETPLLFRNDLP